MKEFMLLIRNEIDHQANWSPEWHQQFLKKCEEYISNLKKGKHLIAAQLMVREGKMIVLKELGKIRLSMKAAK